jgi:hypothetical protein
MPASFATLATASMSTTMPPGLARLSMKIALVRSVSAARKLSALSGSTKLACQPNFL